VLPGYQCDRSTHEVHVDAGVKHNLTNLKKCEIAQLYIPDYLHVFRLAVVRCSQTVAFRRLVLSSLFLPRVNPEQTFSTYLKPRVNSPTVSLSFNWPRLWPDSCSNLNPPVPFHRLPFTVFSCRSNSRPNAATRKSSAGIVLQIRLASSARGDI